MFKLSDNILLHVVCRPALCGQIIGVGAGLKNSTHCIMYKGLARKHEEYEGDSIKMGPAFTTCPHLLPAPLRCYICMGLMLRQDTEGRDEGRTTHCESSVQSSVQQTDMAQHHLNHRLIVHKIPEWTSRRPICFQPVGR